MPDRDSRTGHELHAPASRVPAIERAFGVLLSLTRSGPAPLTEIVAATRLNKSTAFYILRSLVELDAVRYDQRARTYSLGPALVELGNAASRQFDLVAAARRDLAGLVAQFEATVVLYRRIGTGEVSIIDRFERDHGVHITVEPGARLPIQGGSFGRAFLAFDPPATAAEALAGGLVRFTERSTTDLAEFARELDAVRERGWAVDHQGFALGVSTVAAPVFDTDGSVSLVAAAVGFTSRFTDELTADIGARLRLACDRIGRPFAALTAATGPVGQTDEVRDLDEVRSPQG